MADSSRSQPTAGPSRRSGSPSNADSRRRRRSTSPGRRSPRRPPFKRSSVRRSSPPSRRSHNSERSSLSGHNNTKSCSRSSSQNRAARQKSNRERPDLPPVMLSSPPPARRRAASASPLRQPEAPLRSGSETPSPPPVRRVYLPPGNELPPIPELNRSESTLPNRKHNRRSSPNQKPPPKRQSQKEFLESLTQIATGSRASVPSEQQSSPIRGVDTSSLIVVPTQEEEESQPVSPPMMDYNGQVSILRTTSPELPSNDMGFTNASIVTKCEPEMVSIIDNNVTPLTQAPITVLVDFTIKRLHDYNLMQNFVISLPEMSYLKLDHLKPVLVAKDYRKGLQKGNVILSQADGSLMIKYGHKNESALEVSSEKDLAEDIINFLEPVLASFTDRKFVLVLPTIPHFGYINDIFARRTIWTKLQKRFIGWLDLTNSCYSFLLGTSNYIKAVELSGGKLVQLYTHFNDRRLPQQPDHRIEIMHEVNENIWEDGKITMASIEPFKTDVSNCALCCLSVTTIPSKCDCYRDEIITSISIYVPQSGRKSIHIPVTPYSLYSGKMLQEKANIQKNAMGQWMYNGSKPCLDLALAVSNVLKFIQNTSEELGKCGGLLLSLGRNTGAVYFLRAALMCRMEKEFFTVVKGFCDMVTYGKLVCDTPNGNVDSLRKFYHTDPILKQSVQREKNNPAMESVLIWEMLKRMAINPEVDVGKTTFTPKSPYVCNMVYRSYFPECREFICDVVVASDTLLPSSQSSYPITVSCTIKGLLLTKAHIPLIIHSHPRGLVKMQTEGTLIVHSQSLNVPIAWNHEYTKLLSLKRGDPVALAMDPDTLKKLNKESGFENIALHEHQRSQTASASSITRYSPVGMDFNEQESDNDIELLSSSFDDSQIMTQPRRQNSDSDEVQIVESDDDEIVVLPEPIRAEVKVFNLEDEAEGESSKPSFGEASKKRHYQPAVEPAEADADQQPPCKTKRDQQLSKTSFISAGETQQRQNFEITDAELEKFVVFDSEDDELMGFKDYLKSFCQFFKRQGEPVPYNAGDDILDYIQSLDISSLSQLKDKMPEGTVSKPVLLIGMENSFPNHKNLISDTVFPIFLETVLDYWKEMDEPRLLPEATPCLSKPDQGEIELEKELEMIFENDQAEYIEAKFGDKLDLDSDSEDRLELERKSVINVEEFEQQAEVIEQKEVSADTVPEHTENEDPTPEQPEQMSSVENALTIPESVSVGPELVPTLSSSSTECVPSDSPIHQISENFETTKPTDINVVDKLFEEQPNESSSSKILQFPTPLEENLVENISDNSASHQQGSPSLTAPSTGRENIIPASVTLKCKHHGDKEELCINFVQQNCQLGTNCNDSHVLSAPFCPEFASGKTCPKDCSNAASYLHKTPAEIASIYKLHLQQKRRECKQCLSPDLCLDYFQNLQCENGLGCSRQHELPINFQMPKDYCSHYLKYGTNFADPCLGKHISKEQMNSIYKDKRAAIISNTSTVTSCPNMDYKEELCISYYKFGSCANNPCSKQHTLPQFVDFVCNQYLKQGRCSNLKNCTKGKHLTLSSMSSLYRNKLIEHRMECIECATKLTVTELLCPFLFTNGKCKCKKLHEIPAGLGTDFCKAYLTGMACNCVLNKQTHRHIDMRTLNREIKFQHHILAPLPTTNIIRCRHKFNFKGVCWTHFESWGCSLGTECPRAHTGPNGISLSGSLTKHCPMYLKHGSCGNKECERHLSRSEIADMITRDIEKQVCITCKPITSSISCGHYNTNITSVHTLCMNYNRVPMSIQRELESPCIAYLHGECSNSSCQGTHVYMEQIFDRIQTLIQKLKADCSTCKAKNAFFTDGIINQGLCNHVKGKYGEKKLCPALFQPVDCPNGIVNDCLDGFVHPKPIASWCSEWRLSRGCSKFGCNAIHRNYEEAVTWFEMAFLRRQSNDCIQCLKARNCRVPCKQVDVVSSERNLRNNSMSEQEAKNNQSEAMDHSSSYVKKISSEQVLPPENETTSIPSKSQCTEIGINTTNVQEKGPSSPILEKTPTVESMETIEANETCALKEAAKSGEDDARSDKSQLVNNSSSPDIENAGTKSTELPKDAESLNDQQTGANSSLVTSQTVSSDPSSSVESKTLCTHFYSPAQLCLHYICTVWCKHGTACAQSHVIPKKLKRKYCYPYLTRGVCKFGNKCLDGTHITAKDLNRQFQYIHWTFRIKCLPCKLKKDGPDNTIQGCKHLCQNKFSSDGFCCVKNCPNAHPEGFNAISCEQWRKHQLCKTYGCQKMHLNHEEAIKFNNVDCRHCKMKRQESENEKQAGSKRVLSIEKESGDITSIEDGNSNEIRQNISPRVALEYRRVENAVKETSMEIGSNQETLVEHAENKPEACTHYYIKSEEEVCLYYLYHGWCERGTDCSFSHIVSKKLKTTYCRYFLVHGKCKFGSVCLGGQHISKDELKLQFKNQVELLRSKCLPCKQKEREVSIENATKCKHVCQNLFSTRGFCEVKGCPFVHPEMMTACNEWRRLGLCHTYGCSKKHWNYEDAVRLNKVECIKCKMTRQKEEEAMKQTKAVKDSGNSQTMKIPSAESAVNNPAQSVMFSRTDPRPSTSTNIISNNVTEPCSHFYLPRRNICEFYIANDWCRYGSNCPSEHIIPPQLKMKVCKLYLQSRSCSFGSYCRNGIHIAPGQLNKECAIQLDKIKSACIPCRKKQEGLVANANTSCTHVCQNLFGDKGFCDIQGCKFAHPERATCSDWRKKGKCHVFGCLEMHLSYEEEIKLNNMECQTCKIKKDESANERSNKRSCISETDHDGPSLKKMKLGPETNLNRTSAEIPNCSKPSTSSSIEVSSTSESPTKPDQPRKPKRDKLDEKTNTACTHFYVSAIICEAFISKGRCEFGTKCLFGHKIPSKLNWQVCKSYLKMGTCEYGTGCSHGQHIKPGQLNHEYQRLLDDLGNACKPCKQKREGPTKRAECEHLCQNLFTSLGYCTKRVNGCAHPANINAISCSMWRQFGVCDAFGCPNMHLTYEEAKKFNNAKCKKCSKRK